MEKFQCYEADNQEPDDARTHEAWDARDAAQRHAEHRFSDADYPREQTIVVISPDGTREVFSVEAIPEPTFYGARLRGRERDEFLRRHPHALEPAIAEVLATVEPPEGA